MVKFPYQAMQFQYMVRTLALGVFLSFLCGCNGIGKRASDMEEPVFKGSGEKARLVIRLSSVPPEAIIVATAIFPNRESYLTEEGAKYSGKTHLEGPKSDTAEIVLEGLDEGNYAIIVLADTDGDERLKQGLFGIPQEWFGFGNNVMGNFGPPPFEEAVVEIRAPETVVEIEFLPPPFGRPLREDNE